MVSDKVVAARPVGRPPRVTPSEIAEAALAIGLEQATIRNVAERLGMSVPGLYHHVRSREELLAMASAHGLGDLPLPEDHGQAWTEWLLEYGRFVHDALVAQPELIGKILAGTSNTTRMAQHLERFFAVLGGHGFSVAESHAVYRQLTSAVAGAALAEVSRRAATEAGHPQLDDLRRAVRALGAGALPHVRELLDGPPTEGEPFDAVRTVVAGLATFGPGSATGAGRTSSRRS